MIENQEIRNELRELLEYHIILGVEAIFSSIFSTPHQKAISFHQIVNRIMMVAQVPITFGLYKKYNDKFELIHLTNQHKRHQDEIRTRSQHIMEKNLFPLWKRDNDESTYHLLVLKADASYKFEPLEPIKKFDNVENIWDAASYKIWRMLNYKGHALYNDIAEIAVNIFRVMGLEKDENPNRANRKNELEVTIDFEVKRKLDKELLENTTQFNLKGTGVIDKVFNKLSSNLMEITDGVDSIERTLNFVKNSQTKKQKKDGKLTNFFLFARDYCSFNNKHTRYDGDYNYGIRLLLCATQRKEIENHFQWMLKNEKKCRKIYQEQLEGIKHKDNNSKKLAFSVDDEFWKNLKEKNFDHLLDIISGYFSVHTRSMADPVFDGVSFYRQPFAKDAGMGRCFHNGDIPEHLDSLDADSPRRNDLLRVVIFQYLFEAMSAGDNDANTGLQVMLNPIELGGRVWGVVGYTTRSKSPEIEFQSKEEVSEYGRYWLMNYHVYMDANERMKKNLRSSMNRFYETALAKTYLDWILSAIRPANKKSLNGLQTELNDKLLELSCYFPYNVIKATIEEDEESRRDGRLPLPTSNGVVLGGGVSTPLSARRVPIGVGYAASLEVTKRSVFPSAPAGGDTRVFVDIVDVAVAMTNMMVSGVVEEVMQQKKVLAFPR
jgi:hypothetical protein